VDGLCSVREAFSAANTNQPVDGCKAGGPTDIVLIPPGTYTLTQGVVVLEGSTEVRGYGATLSRSVGQQPPLSNEAFVRIAPTAHAVLKGVTLNGSGEFCGGLLNEGNLFVIDGSLTNTRALVPNSCLSGAGLNNRGTATLLRTSITNNQAETGG